MADRTSMDRPLALSRRSVIGGVAATCAVGIAGSRAASAEEITGPIFSPSGPNAELYGSAAGDPVPHAARARQQGNPWNPNDRVGAFTHIAAIYPARLVKRAATPWTYNRAAAALSAAVPGRVAGYLSRHPRPGPLNARG